MPRVSNRLRLKEERPDFSEEISNLVSYQCCNHVIDLTASTATQPPNSITRYGLRPAQVTSYTSLYNFSLPPTLNALSWFYKTHCNHKIRPIMVVRNPFCSTVGRAASQLTSHPARQANTLRLRRRSLCAISSSTPTHNLSANLPPSLRLPGRREAVNRLNVWHPSHPPIPLDPLSYFSQCGYMKESA